MNRTPQAEQASAVRPSHRQHAPLSAINTREATALRSAGRILDVPGRRPSQPITFDSAL